MLDAKQPMLDDSAMLGNSLIALNDFENTSESMRMLIEITLTETQSASCIPSLEDIGEFGSTGKYSTQRQALPKLDDSNSPINISGGEVDEFSQLLVNAVDALVEVTEHIHLARLTEDSYSEFRNVQDKLSEGFLLNNDTKFGFPDF